MLTWILLASMFIAQGDGFKLVATAQQLMDAMVIPASDVLFNVAFDVPENDEASAAVENNAILLAESGNLLLMRADGREDWADASRALIAAGEKSLEAARGRDPEVFLDLSEDILAPCSGCHDVYMAGAQQ